MKKLIIIGARGFGREIYFAALESIGYQTDYEIKGYLDDKSDALASYHGYPPIIDSVENYTPQPNDVFICALGDVKYKKKYVNMILAKGGTFINLIHKDAYVSPNVCLGTGCIILAHTRISCDVVIGDFVTIQPRVFLGHDVCIGNWSLLNTNSVCNGFVKIGNDVTINTSAVIVPKVNIGDNSVIGACSMVLRKVPENVTVMGNPARKIFG